MMFARIKKNHFAIFVYFYLLWSLMALFACNDIPPASILISGKVRLTWDNVPGATSYNIYMSASPGVSRFNGYKIRDASNPITLTDLEPGTTYYFVITAVNEFGESKESGEFSYTAIANTAGFIYFKDPSFKSMPADNSGKSEKGHSESAIVPNKATQPFLDDNLGTQQVTLTWDNVPNAISYNVYWSNSPGVTRHNGIKVSSEKNSVTITGLKNGTTYYFVVTAINSLGESRESQELSFTVGE
jgi:fibronectin type 3 domain-containing protein